MTQEIEDFRKFINLEQPDPIVEDRIVLLLARLSQDTYVGAVERACKKEVEWLRAHYPATTLLSWLYRYDAAIRACFQEIPIPEALAYKQQKQTGVVYEHVAHLILRASKARLADSSGEPDIEITTSQPPSRVERFTLSLDKRLITEINDRESWGEGTPDERLARIIAKARTADTLQAELQLEREKIAALRTQIKMLEALGIAQKKGPSSP